MTLDDIAKEIGCDVHILNAVASVESNGSGFDSKGRPVILFEGHKFYKFTGGKYGLSDISYPAWTSKYYSKNEYDRLDRARKLDDEAALKSASWGKYQVMGFNFALCGCDDVYEFVLKQAESTDAQNELFFNFLVKSGFRQLLISKNFAEIARKYNGTGYRTNRYDEKLKAAYYKSVSNR